MTFGSVCSGIEAVTVAWQPLGWSPAFYAEIDPFPCALLRHYHPEIPNLGNITKFQAWPHATLDVLVGGTPCQSFSVAGLRAGLADPRGNLALVYLAILDRYRPRWCVWENVPGVLSSDGGRDFGAFLGGLGQLGYGFAYRVLDAQHFGLAQRRKRVFVVGHLGSWPRAAAVLFERASLSGHPAPRREAGQDTAGSTGDGVARCITVGEAQRQDWETCNLIAHAFDARQSDVIQYGDQAGPLDTDGHTIAVAFSVKDYGADAGPIAPTLRAGNHTTSHANGGVMPAVAFRPTGGTHSVEAMVELSPSLKVGSGLGIPSPPGIMRGMAVRRLTPRECERLQGFPDDYTLIPYRGKPAADGPRYKALGNSMVVPVMTWIGRRIQMVEAIP